MVFWLVPEPTLAQSGGDIQIDCGAFRQENDGHWVSTRRTTIEMAGNKLTIGGGQTPQGSVNGVQIQAAIGQKCSAGQSDQGKRDTVFAFTNYIINKQTLQECLDRARTSFQVFPKAQVFGESVAAFSQGYTFLIRCTPHNAIFFALVGPAGASDQANEAELSQLKDIINKW